MNEIKEKIIRFALALIMVISVNINAFSALKPPAPADLDTVATISLVTSYPGPRNFEHYGHTMVRAQIKGFDLVVNWGIFSFKEPNFIYRFVKGECDYKATAYPWQYVTMGYEGRRMVEQVLNLDSVQARRVVEYMLWNILPENCVYRYGYAYNNCATQPRDILERATEGKIHYAELDTLLTFRKVFNYYDRNYPWQRFGINEVLGQDIDHPLTEREYMFLPMGVEQVFAAAQIERDGVLQPLVKETRFVIEGNIEGWVDEPTPWYFTPWMAVALLALLTIAISVCDMKRGKVSRIYDSLFYLIQAVQGCIVFFLVFFSTHYGTTANWNFMWLNPLYFLPIVLTWIPKARKALVGFHWFSIVMLAVFEIIALTIAPQHIDGEVHVIVLASMMRSVVNVKINRLNKK